MGTTWSVRIPLASSTETAAIETSIHGELDMIVAQMSPWVEDSELSRFNRARAGTAHALPDPFFEVLEHALWVARESRGAFDPTIAPLVDLWGFGPRPSIVEPPPTVAIEIARSRVGHHRIVLDTHRRTATQPGDAMLDLSAIAKGYGVDRVAEALRGRGHRHFLVEVGGELRGEGMRPDGQPWWVELETPGLAHDSRSVETVLALHGLSVATSGDYRRSFVHQGARYSHTLDGRTGWPVKHDLAAVTVVHPSCMSADAWSTALMGIGAEEGSAFAAERGLAARFLRRDPHGFLETHTPAFAEMLR